jgi:hypothetical protein
MKTWQDAVQAWKSYDHGGVIAGYKLCSNDGWNVTPAEITRALDAYARWCAEQRDGQSWRDPKVVAETDASSAWYEVTQDEQGVTYWEKWLAFLDVSRDHGGFEVW